MEILDVVSSTLFFLGGLLLLLLLAFCIISFFASITKYFEARRYQIDLDNFITENSYKERYPEEFNDFFDIKKK